MKTHQLINQDSGNTDYFTQRFIIEAAREVMGKIYLDPASNQKANLIVKARRYWGPGDRVLEKKIWVGKTIWMNHPFGKLYNGPFVKKFIEARATHRMCITYASTAEKWFKPLLIYGMQCWLSPRTNYLDKNLNTVKGVTKGSVITYIGPNKMKFVKSFKKYGVVK